MIQPEPSHVQADVPTEPDQPALMPEPARAARETARSARTKSEASRKKTSKQTVEPAAVDPVAQVLVDVPLAHLDRPFDYVVPAALDEVARPGVRVRVRFAGRLVDGYLVERAAASEHPGRLAQLQKVVSAEPVLAPEVLTLAREVADHYAGTVPDVLRLAVPPRHARTEARSSDRPAELPERPATGTWERYHHGQALLDAVHEG
ncbi:MAG: primosome assembly protein PriA, partial [Nocardioidaceae bacterium]